MVHAFVSILKDIEAEVKTSACGQISGFCSLIAPEIITAEFFPCVKELVTDGSQHVRAALALHISGLAPILGKAQYYLTD
jgi:serine/threonine-protein phosphatase 2A regulatory subunit A